MAEATGDGRAVSTELARDNPVYRALGRKIGRLITVAGTDRADENRRRNPPRWGATYLSYLKHRVLGVSGGLLFAAKQRSAWVGPIP